MSGIINIYNEDTHSYVSIPAIRGPQGETGVSIVKVEKSRSVSNVDYYKITLSNGNYSEFTVTNGTGMGDMTQAVYDTDNNGIVDKSTSVINTKDQSTVLGIWKGTKAEYDAITTKDPNVVYIISDIVYEDSSNKVYELKSSSTNTQYPGAKVVYDNLELKVDKEAGKGLSTNDYDATEKTNVANNTSARHTHDNKALLDTYTQTEANLADAVSKKHEHSNKTVLDNTTASYTTAEQTKLSGIEMGAQVNTVNTVASRSGDVVLTASDIGTGTLPGQINANADAMSSVSTAQIRNIYAGTDDLTAGTSVLATGTIYFVYEA